MRKEILMVGVAQKREKKFSWWGRHNSQKKNLIVKETQKWKKKYNGGSGTNKK
jgi:hypothetical protein